MYALLSPRGCTEAPNPAGSYTLVSYDTLVNGQQVTCYQDPDTITKYSLL